MVLVSRRCRERVTSYQWRKEKVKDQLMSRKTRKPFSAMRLRFWFMIKTRKNIGWTWVSSDHYWWWWKHIFWTISAGLTTQSGSKNGSDNRSYDLIGYWCLAICCVAPSDCWLSVFSSGDRLVYWGVTLSWVFLYRRFRKPSWFFTILVVAMGQFCILSFLRCGEGSDGRLIKSGAVGTAEEAFISRSLLITIGYLTQLQSFTVTSHKWGESVSD